MQKFKHIYSHLLRLYGLPTLILVGLFSLGIILGIVLPSELKLILLESIADKFEGILNSASTDFELSLRIMWNNIFVSLILFILGFTLIVPIIVVVSNGMIIGLFFSLFYRVEVFSPGIFISSLISLIPHGIFEMTAFFLAGALSITALAKMIFSSKIAPQRKRLQFLLDTVLRFVGIIVPMLLIAGFVEVYISHIPGEWYANSVTEKYTDASLAIQIDTTFLEQYGCAELQAGESTAAFSSDSLLAVGQVVFDETSYALLKQRKHLPNWSIEYECNDDEWISIQAWDATQWSTDQAQEVRQKTLAATETPFQLNNHLFTIEQDSKTYYSHIGTTDTTTYELQYSTDQITKKSIHNKP